MGRAETFGATDGLADREVTGEMLHRYRRQLILDEIGVEGQMALAAARVVVVGTGGLGAPVLLYLAAAGVGRITIVDFDTVDLTNLHRQVLFAEADLGQPKIATAAARLRQLNGNTELELIEDRFTPENAATILDGQDLVVDATDNFRARYAINDAAVAAGIPNVSAAILRFEAQLTVYDPASGGPCYRCLYPAQPPADLAPSCADAGVIGVLPGIIGCLQANEAIKLICGHGAPLTGRLLTFDAAATRFCEYRVERRADCPCAVCPPRAATRRARRVPAMLTVAQLRAALDGGEDLQLLDVREPAERDKAMIPGSLHIPLGYLPRRKSELSRAAHLACICKSGQRSLLAAQLLLASGFGDVANVIGGMDAWMQGDG